jgi:peptide deformylase
MSRSSASRTRPRPPSSTPRRAPAAMPRFARAQVRRPGAARHRAAGRTLRRGAASEVERMGELMHDALGVGLAATQLGVLHRVLVYRAYADDPVTALVNPVLEWTSEELETAEEGCLSLPGVHVEVERHARLRVRAQDEAGAEREIEAEGLEARVIQHEIDHLNGVLVLDRISREARKEAMRAMREAQAEAHERSEGNSRAPAEERTPPSAGGGERVEHSLPRHQRVRRGGARAAGARRGPSPGARAHAPRPPARPRAAPGVSPVAETARSLAIPLEQPQSVNDPQPRALIARALGGRCRDADPANAGTVCRVRLRRADQGAAAVRARDPQRPPLAAAALARSGADRARDHGRRRAHRRVDHAPHRGTGQRPGVPGRRGADRPDDTYGSLATRLQALGGELLVRALEETRARRRSPSRPEEGVTYAEKIGRRGPPARPRRGRRPSSSASCARCTRTSARGSSSPTGRCSRAARARTTVACCSTAAQACSSCCRAAAGRPRDGRLGLPARSYPLRGHALKGAGRRAAGAPVVAHIRRRRDALAGPRIRLRRARAARSGITPAHAPSA